LDFSDFYNISRATSEAYKVTICTAGVVLALIWQLPRLQEVMPSFGIKRREVLLAAFVLVSTLNYFRWGPAILVDRIDVYDQSHYYLNAKYFDELGYYDLYPAMLLVDRENGGPHFKKEGTIYLAQDETGHVKKPIMHGVRRGQWVKENKFSESQWLRFSHDTLHITRKERGWNSKLWRQMIQDHGYNGTTVWTLIAAPIAKIIPVEYIKLTCYFDVAMLLGAIYAVYWAYGATTAGWTWAFLMVTYSLRWPQVGWVFLRYDYLAALMVAMALLRQGKHYWAGIFAGYSAVLRMFPAMWMYGPFAKGVAGLVQGKVNKPLLVFAGAFMLSAATLQAGAVLRFGTEEVSVHFENMRDHNDPMQLSSRRIGLALALPFRGETMPKFIETERKVKIQEQKPLRYGLALLVMLALGFGLRKRRDDEAFAIGFVVFFLLTTASYYYYASRVTLAMLHASDLDKSTNRIGLAFIIGMELFTNWAETNLPGHRIFLVGWLSWLMCAYIIFLCVAWIAESFQQEDEPAS